MIIADAVRLYKCKGPGDWYMYINSDLRSKLIIKGIIRFQYTWKIDSWHIYIPNYTCTCIALTRKYFSIVTGEHDLIHKIILRYLGSNPRPLGQTDSAKDTTFSHCKSIIRWLFKARADRSSCEQNTGKVGLKLNTLNKANCFYVLFL